MKLISIPLTLTILLVSVYGINAYEAHSDQFQATIVSYNHHPTVPMNGSDVNVTATISMIPMGFNNLTLAYEINNTNLTKIVMTNTKGLQFLGTIPGQVNATVVYWLELYVGGSMVDRAPDVGGVSINFSGVQGIIPVSIQLGLPIDLPAGNFSLFTPDGMLTIGINVSKAIQVNISTVEIKPDDPILKNYNPVSLKYSIEVNSTESLTSAQLKIGYSQETIDENGINEAKLKLLKIKNGNIEEYPAIVDTIGNRIIANTTEFSEWVASTDKALLKIMDLTYPDTIPLETRLSISFRLTNFGNTVALNTTVRIFKHKDVTIVNNKTEFNLPWVNPLENFTFSLDFFIEVEGNYSFIVSVENDGTEAATETLLITAQGQNLIQSQSSRVSTPIISSIIVLILIVKWKKR